MHKQVTRIKTLSRFNEWIALLRWNKPSGRLILLIPAGWSLWMSPSAPPTTQIVILIIAGGLLVSAAGCITNDLWDKKIDGQVSRTLNRPLAKGSIESSSAFILLLLCLILSLFVVINLPGYSRGLSLRLAMLALPLIVLYPSAKRWFPLPQALLAFCWGFAVLIPWGASEGNLNGGLPLLGTWLATIFWTFGFDTVYAMADKEDDQKIGLKSSAVLLGDRIELVVVITYALASIFLGLSAYLSGISLIFWPVWLIGSAGMQLEGNKLRKKINNNSFYGTHFKNQVKLGALLLLGLVLGRV